MHFSRLYSSPWFSSTRGKKRQSPNITPLSARALLAHLKASPLPQDQTGSEPGGADVFSSTNQKTQKQSRNKRLLCWTQESTVPAFFSFKALSPVRNSYEGGHGAQNTVDLSDHQLLEVERTFPHQLCSGSLNWKELAMPWKHSNFFKAVAVSKGMVKEMAPNQLFCSFTKKKRQKNDSVFYCCC